MKKMRYARDWHLASRLLSLSSERRWRNFDIIDRIEGEMDTGPGEITRLLGELREGKRDAEARLMEAVLPELKRRAASYLRGERPGHTLQTTALVNEAYLELTGRSQVDWKDGPHFFAVAAEAMRRILLNYARPRNPPKRG